MRIGCVKEIKNREYRVGLTPDNVKSYVNAGHEVLLEAGAGLGSGCTKGPEQGFVPILPRSGRAVT